MAATTPLLVLGLGNLLCGDDGLGSAAIARLDRDWEAPEGVLVLDGGTLGLTLLPYVEDAIDVILVDAIRDDAPPGSLVRLQGEEVAPAVLHRLSPHQVGVADLLDGARLHDRYPRRLVLLGLVPRTLGLGADRSRAVANRIPELIDRIVAEAQSMGHVFSRRTNDEKALRPPGDVARVFGL